MHRSDPDHKVFLIILHSLRGKSNITIGRDPSLVLPRHVFGPFQAICWSECFRLTPSTVMAVSVCVSLQLWSGET